MRQLPVQDVLRSVLRYAHQLEAKNRTVGAVLAVEREPSDTSWSDLCSRLDVALVWPGTFKRLRGSIAT